MLALLLALAFARDLAISLAGLPPPALHHSVGYGHLRVEESSAGVDWDTLRRRLVLRGLRHQAPWPYEVSFECSVDVGFWPTAAAGLEPRRLAVAGRDGPRVRVELWTVLEALGGRGPDLALKTFTVTERRCVWESRDGDSLALMVWNPHPPAGARHSLRVLWHARRELGRLDVDASGWATYVPEATPYEGAPRGVLHVPELAEPLVRGYLAEHAERGLVLMLQSPLDERLWACEGPGPELSLALIDRDLDGRLDSGRRIELSTWHAESWGQLDTFARIHE